MKRVCEATVTRRDWWEGVNYELVVSACVALAARGSRWCAVHRHEQTRELWPMELEPDEEFVGEMVPCSECRNTGQCGLCDGEGTHRCSDYECDGEHDCGKCQGSGKCRRCEGAAGTMWRKRKDVAA